MVKRYIIPLFAMLMLQLSCQNENNSAERIPTSTFTGDPAAVHQAEAMFKAIGGKENWASLKSLYVYATHEEPNLNHPYESRIWRAIDEFKIRIEQKNVDFHNIGVFKEDDGWIMRLNNDTTLKRISRKSKLSKKQVEGWKYGNSNNVYVLLHKLSMPGKYIVQSGIDDRIEFFEDSTFLCAFKPDSLNRPHIFIVRDQEGKEQESGFEKWGKTNGLVHSAGGGPTDGSFVYVTEEWVPSNRTFDEAFDVDTDLDAETIYNRLEWLQGKWKNVSTSKNHYEIWKKEDGQYLGNGFALKGADTSFSEKVSIGIKNDVLQYVPQVSDQNKGRPVSFEWVFTDKDHHVFLNPKHDFPNYISYELLSPDSMQALVWGIGKMEKAVQFKFAREK